MLTSYVISQYLADIGFFSETSIGLIKKFLIPNNSLRINLLNNLPTHQFIYQA